MTAEEVPDGTWFYVLRNKKWFAKKRNGKTQVEAFQIGSKKKYLFPYDEEVTIKGQTNES